MKTVAEILKGMQPNQKINYDKVLKQVIENWQQEQLRPTVLLHSCCAPCSTSSLEYLVTYADVTVYFANSNIHPRTEYLRRELVQKEFITAFNQKSAQQVKFLAAPYEPQAFIKMVKEGQWEAEPEGGKRCRGCFEMRLDLVAQKAQELGYDYFGSALTLSPKKDSQLINQLGIEIQEFYQTAYLPSDFKKNNGYKRSIEMCQEYDVYRQCYCGCLYAAKDQGVDLKAITRESREFLQQRQGIVFKTVTKNQGDDPR